VVAEIQLLTCGYSAQCTVRNCPARAATIARYIDDGGAPLRQRELCARHAVWFKEAPTECPRFEERLRWLIPRRRVPMDF
jgi:hypothetical protein